MTPRFPAIRETALSGCFQLQLFRHQDRRGLFLKTFEAPAFQALGLVVDWKEEYISTSAKGVLRGMHFQAPPHDHVKLVTCLAGRVLDVVLDLREGSPTYGQCASLELSPSLGNAIYIPAGLAHGFLSLEEGSLLHYKVTTVHAPAQDSGVLWSSIPFTWPEAAPVLSDRDGGFPPLASFKTPFHLVTP